MRSLILHFFAAFFIEPTNQIIPHQCDLVRFRHDAGRWQFQRHHRDAFIEPGIVAERSRVDTELVQVQFTDVAWCFSGTIETSI